MYGACIVSNNKLFFKQYIYIFQRMDRTPKSKFSLSCKSKYTEKHESSATERINSNSLTPTQNTLRSLCDNDYSPVYIPCTQEAFDQLDVVWDWNSPQSKQQKKKPGNKRSHTNQSPKLPIKKHSSNNQIQSYDTLKTELEALKNQLVHESKDDRSASKTLFCDKINEKNELKNLDDFFNDDSLEEEMILHSQKIEELLTLEIKQYTCDKLNYKTIHLQDTLPKPDLRKVKSDNHLADTLQHGTKYNLENELHQKVNFEFTTSIENIRDDSVASAVDSIVNNEGMLKNSTKYEQVLNTNQNCRTTSETNKICSSEEIEKKRLEALAKLHSKKVLPFTTMVSKKDTLENESCGQHICKDETSPIKCSPQEIEQKRLQALAKLEAKKKQEIIEKNRREALKRLEISKKKRAMTSQHFSIRK